MSALTDQIAAQTPDGRVQLSMMMGALLEGGSLTGPWPTGDSGTSFGPFQLHQGGALGTLTPDQANDPATAVHQMLSAYQDAVNAVPASLWATDARTAAAQAAYLAERPAYMYPIARVQSAWDALTGGAPVSATQATGSGDPANCAFWVNLGFRKVCIIPDIAGAIGKNVPGADLGGNAVSGALGGVTGALDKIGSFFGLLVDPHTWAKLGLTIAAVFLVGVGVFLFAQSSPEVRSMEAGSLKAAAV